MLMAINYTKWTSNFTYVFTKTISTQSNTLLKSNA